MPGSVMSDAQALPAPPMKSPTGPAWRADAGVYSPEGIRGSRRLRSGRCMHLATCLLLNSSWDIQIHASVVRSAPAPAAGQTYPVDLHD